MSDYCSEDARRLGSIENWSGLLSYAQDWRNTDPANYLPQYYLGIALSQLGLKSAAIEAYEKAVSLNSRDASVWGNLAITVGELRGFTEAEAFHKIAIQTDASHANSHYNYGTLLGQHGRSGEAAIMLAIAHKLAPDRIDILGTLIKALDDQREFVQIRQLLPACRTLDPLKAEELEAYLRSRGV